MVRELGSPSPIQLTQTEFPVRQTFWAPDASLLYFVLQTSRGELWGISPAGGQPTRILDGVVTANVSPDGKTLALWRVSAQGPPPNSPSPIPPDGAPSNSPDGAPPNSLAGAPPRGPRGAGPKIRGSVWISSPPGSPPKRYEPAPFETPEIDINNRVAFSPDGHSILLTEGNGASQAWLLPYPAGGAPKRLFAQTDLGVSPRAGWMPDSRHVILSFAGSLSGGSDLWMADVQTQKMTQLTFGTLSREQPSLAPDGTRLVFSNIQDDFNVIELSLAGGPPKTLLGNSRNELSPSWSPEGDQLAYSTDRTGEREIWIRNLTDGLDRPVVRAKDFPKGSTTGLTSPVYSPDGSRIAFVRYSSEDPATIWVAPAVGGAPIRLTSDYMVSPVWAPDGGRVAGLMQRDNPGEPAIVGVGADMTPHLIPHAPLCRSPLAWSPTGQWLACESREEITLFSEDGSQQRRLPKTDAASLVFSQDGKTIYAVGRDAGRSFLKAVDVTSGAVRSIADYGTDLIFSGGMPYHTRLSLAPDGKALVTSAVALKSDLWLLDGYPMPSPWWKFW
jgi:WD40 repeat protein